MQAKKTTLKICKKNAKTTLKIFKIKENQATLTLAWLGFVIPLHNICAATLEYLFSESSLRPRLLALLISEEKRFLLFVKKFVPTWMSKVCCFQKKCKKTGKKLAFCVFYVKKIKKSIDIIVKICYKKVERRNIAERRHIYAY